MKAPRKKTISASSLALMTALLCSSNAFAQDNDPAESEFLGTVELAESKREISTDTAVAQTIVGQEEINDRQATTVAELIDSVPGVTLINGSTPTGSGINIRGFGANGIYGTDQKVAIFVDGATTGAEELYRIGNQLFTDPYLYKNVNIIRGTIGSFEYGSGIVGGIVQLETKDASDLTGGKPGFKLGVTVGGATNGNAFNTSLVAAYQPTENLELLGNFSYREQDNQKDGNGNEIGNSSFELPSFLIKGRYIFGIEKDHSLSASYTQSSSSDRDVPYDTFVTATDFFGNVDRDVETQAAALKYQYDPESELINFNVELTYSNQEIDQEYVEGSSTFAFAPVGGFSVVSADHQYETTKLNIRNASYIEQGPLTHNIRYGLEILGKDRLDASAAPGGTDDRFSVFFVDDIEIGDKLTVTPALRHERAKLEGVLTDGTESGVHSKALLGGISARYEILDGLAAFASYAHTESFPSLDDFQNDAFREQAEIADTIEFGAAYETLGFLGGNNRLTLKANYYETELDDVTSYSGVSSVDLNGIEIEGSVAFRSGFYADLNANFVNGDEEQSTGDVVDWRNAPADNFRASIGKRFGQTLDLSAEVVVDRSTTRSILEGGGRTGLPITIGSTETDGYEVLNLRGTYSPQSGVLEGTDIRISIENALDKRYEPLLATRNSPGRNVKMTVSRLFF